MEQAAEIQWFGTEGAGSPWIVVFCPGTDEDMGPWKWFGADKDYAHIFLTRYNVATGSWVLINPASIHMELDVLTDRDATRMWIYIKKHATVALEMMVDTTHVRRMMLPWTWYNCVNVAKHILRLKSTWTLTPRQLAKEMQRRGAHVFSSKEQPDG